VPLETCFENSQDEPFPGSHHNIIHLQQGVPDHVSEAGYCRYYTERGYRMGDHHSIKALQWLAYIGRKRNYVTHAGNWQEVHFTGLPNLKVDVYCAETNEVFEYLGCFGMGVHVCRIDTSQLAKTMKHC